MNLSELKQQLDDFNEKQRNAFSEAKDVQALIYERSDFYDRLLLTLWKSFGFHKRKDLTLVPVGGYGRREMFPLSDVDILILTEAELDDETQSQFNDFFMLLWDAKLQVGSAIRTLDECITIGKEEISVATNMLEGRFLTGNSEFFYHFLERIHQDDFWEISEFFDAKVAEKDERYGRYNNTSYNLEPDLKHSPGGLRDLHLLTWIMLRHYGVFSLSELFEQELLFPEEYIELEQAEAVLFRMRFGLHLLLKRYDNRLRFNRQIALSELLGYKGEGNKPVELMMREYFQATQSISQLSQLLLDNFDKIIIKNFRRKGEIRQLDENFYIQEDMIYSTNYGCFVDKPCSILDLFYHLTTEPKAVASVSALRYLRLAVQKQKTSLSEIPEARTRFIELFSQPNFVKRAIKPMHDYGVLKAYLPQWKNIKGLMQFDMFHIYTVDEHTIRTMSKVESFLDEESKEKYPICHSILTNFEKRPLIYLAAMFHDIAKGRGGKHEEKGAVDMYQFAKQHDFSETDSRLMAWLVAEHLLMSKTAQRRDIYDPEVIQEFAKSVVNQTALSALLCLTVADICSTNKTLWNEWKRQLFTQLFESTKEQLKRGEEVAVDYKQAGLENRKLVKEALEKEFSFSQMQAVFTFWNRCPVNYFVRNTPEQLMWQIRGYLENNATLPLVLVDNQNHEGLTEVFVSCEDIPHLFSKIAQVLSQKKMNILDAQIISNNKLVFDSFIVSEHDGKPLSEERCIQLQKVLLKVLTEQRAKEFKLIKKPVKFKSFNRETKVTFLENARIDQTGFELKTMDREGVLAHISDIFNELNLNLINAKITTIGERVEDFFVLSNMEDKALSDEEKETLLERILEEF